MLAIPHLRRSLEGGTKKFPFFYDDTAVPISSAAVPSAGIYSLRYTEYSSTAVLYCNTIIVVVSPSVRVTAVLPAKIRKKTPVPFHLRSVFCVCYV